MKYGADLVVGDQIWGRRILSLQRAQVPARALIKSVAAQHPDGLPAWYATITSPHTKSGTIEITLFLDDYYPPENGWRD